jgi:hypothetical protein
MDYIFEHEGRAFTPNGQTEPGNAQDRNRETERKEIVWLMTGPDRAFLYVTMPSPVSLGAYSWAQGDAIRSCCRLARHHAATACPVCQRTAAQMEGDYRKRIEVKTWLGTSVATHVYIGPRRNVGFGWHTYRRAVSCRIGGVLYHGWFFESSGDYCRLRKAKRQPAV